MENNQRILSAIVVVAENGAIGRDGGLLCHLPADLRHFKDLTMGHSIVMGRRTFESFPKGALPGRQNIVITHNKNYHPQGVTVVHSVDEALQAVEMPGDVFIIGGAQIYAATFEQVQTLHLTRLCQHPHPQYNKYLDPDLFRTFTIDDGNVVWGEDWDLIFPVENLYAGKAA